MSELKNPAFADMDALLDASMDDIADLPPIGVPPTGSYNLSVTASREKGKEGKADFIQLEYIVEEINELKYEEEQGDVKVGQSFKTFFSPFKKDGTVNDTGLGYMKQELVPFAAHFGTGSSLGATIAAIQSVKISASIIRVQDKTDETRFNCRFRDVIVL